MVTKMKAPWREATKDDEGNVKNIEIALNTAV
jgi:hypothetical protein